jgi:hypothetical protein
MNTSDNRALVDTNVLVYAADTPSFHEPSGSPGSRLPQRGSPW